MVGGTIKDGFERINHTVLVHDIKLGTNISDVLPTDVVFLCLPTPTDLGGACYTTGIANTIYELKANKYSGVIVIKSTVPPGFTDSQKERFPLTKFAYCPEFLREKARHTDFIDNHDVCIIGCYHESTFDIIKEAHGRLPKQFAMVTPLEAEFCKYFSNVFNAMRIVFANEFYDVCKAAGADYTNIKNAITKRQNIPDFYLECNEHVRAFGGNCLPKDTLAFASFTHKLGLSYNLFDYIIKSNQRIKDTKR